MRLIGCFSDDPALDWKGQAMIEALQAVYFFTAFAVGITLISKGIESSL